jgi:hypothetical protein
LLESCQRGTGQSRQCQTAPDCCEVRGVWQHTVVQSKRQDFAAQIGGKRLDSSGQVGALEVEVAVLELAQRDFPRIVRIEVQPQPLIHNYPQMRMTGIVQVTSIIQVSDGCAAELLRQAHETASLQQMKACVELLKVRTR